MLNDWRCAGCRQSASPDADSGVGNSLSSTTSSTSSNSRGASGEVSGSGVLELSPIGVVSSWFPERRGTPRQPGVSGSARGKLMLFNTVFTNPEHALEGLEEYSHMWYDSQLWKINYSVL